MLRLLGQCFFWTCMFGLGRGAARGDFMSFLQALMLIAWWQRDWIRDVLLERRWWD